MKEFDFWEEIDETLEEQFPKGKCKERGNALVLNAIFHIQFGRFIRLIESDLHWKFDEGDLGIIINIIKKRAGDLK